MSSNKDISKRLYYFSTFDGYLDKRGENHNSRLSVVMKDTNADYIWEVALALEEASIGYKVWEPAINLHDGCNRQQQIRVQSSAHPKLTAIRNRVYIDGHKVIDPHMLTMMDAEALTIVFMADGSRKNVALVDGSMNPLYRLHTNGFSYADNMSLADAIKEKLNIPFNVERQATNKWGLTLPKKFNSIFETTVSPFILESFNYKLGR